MTYRMHPDMRLGEVKLKVSDLERSVRFYEEVVGLKTLHRNGNTAELTADGQNTLVALKEIPEAVVTKRRSASGLYHFALLLPTRKDLGLSLRRLIESGIHIGQSDHFVSEALYISDPDNNGIEIYRDRPRGSAAAEQAVTLGEIEREILPSGGISLFVEFNPVGGPLRDFAENRLERFAFLRQRVLDSNRRLWIHFALHDAFVLQFLQPLGQHFAAQVGKVGIDLPEPPRTGHQIVYDQRYPSFAQQLRRFLKPRAYVLFVQWYHLSPTSISYTYSKCLYNLNINSNLTCEINYYILTYEK